VGAKRGDYVRLLVISFWLKGLFNWGSALFIH